MLSLNVFAFSDIRAGVILLAVLSALIIAFTVVFTVRELKKNNSPEDGNADTASSDDGPVPDADNNN